MMGDDFKLKIEGVCELDAIHSWGDGYGGSLSIEGTGTITVNADKLNEYAIALHAERSDSTLNFGKNVNVTLFAQKNAAIIDMANPFLRQSLSATEDIIKQNAKKPHMKNMSTKVP